MSTRLGVRPFQEQRCIPLRYTAKARDGTFMGPTTVICYDDPDQTLAQTMMKLDTKLRDEHLYSSVSVWRA